MATLHENYLLFNSKISISNNGRNLSTDSGLILAKEFMHKINFIKVLKEKLTIKDSRLYYKHNNYSIIEQLLFQLIAGYKTDSSADILSKNSIFQSVLGKERFASQPSISRLLCRLS